MHGPETKMPGHAIACPGIKELFCRGLCGLFRQPTLAVRLFEAGQALADGHTAVAAEHGTILVDMIPASQTPLPLLLFDTPRAMHEVIQNSGITRL